MSGPAAGWLPGGRLHLQHGPIDLVIEAFGPPAEVAAAYRQAWAAFRPVLDDLVAVLPVLRTPVDDLAPAAAEVDTTSDCGLAGSPYSLPARPQGRAAPDLPPEGALAMPPAARAASMLSRAASGHPPRGALQVGRCPPLTDQRFHETGFPTAGQRPPFPPGAIDPLPPRGGEMERGGARPADGGPATLDPASPAAAMIAAAARHAPAFVTPMAAVAGAVADHVLAGMTAGRRLERAYVNNGGDAALWLTPGTELAAAGGPALADRIHVTADSPVRGVATSGWRGRSHSLGIADAVTVLARTAAEADVAATLIANAIDLPGHPAVTRRAARDLAPDSDLGDRPVTVEVGPLSPAEVARALAAGRAAAEAMHRDALITAAALWLAGESVTVGDVPRAAGAFPARA